jgi:hypothetical protein
MDASRLVGEKGGSKSCMKKITEEIERYQGSLVVEY